VARQAASGVEKRQEPRIQPFVAACRYVEKVSGASQAS